MNDSEWDGIRRKYWHGRDTYYLPIVTWNNGHLVREHFQGQSIPQQGSHVTASHGEKREVASVLEEDINSKKPKMNFL